MRLQPVTTPEISVQLYAIHQALDQDLDGSLARVADIGLRMVEAFDFVRRAEPLRESLDRYGLSSPTAHAILIEEEGVATPDGLLSVPPTEETFAAAKTLGVNVVIDPFVARIGGRAWRTSSATPTGSTPGRPRRPTTDYGSATTTTTTN
jgi:hypothetical protein